MIVATSHDCQKLASVPGFQDRLLNPLAWASLANCQCEHNISFCYFVGLKQLPSDRNHLAVNYHAPCSAFTRRSHSSDRTMDNCRNHWNTMANIVANTANMFGMGDSSKGVLRRAHIRTVPGGGKGIRPAHFRGGSVGVKSKFSFVWTADWGTQRSRKKEVSLSASTRRKVDCHDSFCQHVKNTEHPFRDV